MDQNNPSPDQHLNVLYRQTYNTLGIAVAVDFTQDNLVGDDQKKNNAQLMLPKKTNKGLLAGSVAAVYGSGTIGPCAGDSSTTFDKAVGIVVNDAVGNPFESSSGIASQRIVYAHGTGTVISTDIYETKGTDGTAAVTYTAGDRVYSSRHGILTNTQGMDNTSYAGTLTSLIGIVLKAPVPGTDPYMTVQLRI